MGPKVKGDAVASSPVPVETTDERRRSPRVLVDIEVDCASEDNYLFAYITDINATGIFVRTTSPEEPGTHLNLRLSADEDPEEPMALERRSREDQDDRRERVALELEGEVIWVNPYRPGTPDNVHPGMGIRFVNLDSELRDRLFEL
ncbi:MAG TPA: PilZ domain-containing protein, partial [Kofleriaceae bacterium]